VVLSYLLLNRNVIEQLEDLADREEARIGARIAIARYWSVFGSTVVDLTDKKEAPGVPSDGFEPVKHRLGIDYKDDCLNIAFTCNATIRWSATRAPTTTFSYGWCFAIWEYKDCVEEVTQPGFILRTVNRPPCPSGTAKSSPAPMSTSAWR
jgi:hypothetical protein